MPREGESPIHDIAASAIELIAPEPISEWGGMEVRIMLEEDAVFEGGRVTYIDGRQTDLHVMR